jgi:hypothetical protein
MVPVRHEDRSREEVPEIRELLGQVQAPLRAEIGHDVLGIRNESLDPVVARDPANIIHEIKKIHDLRASHQEDGPEQCHDFRDRCHEKVRQNRARKIGLVILVRVPARFVRENFSSRSENLVTSVRGGVDCKPYAATPVL